MLDDVTFAALDAAPVDAPGALPDAPLPMPPRLLERPRRRRSLRWLRLLGRRAG